MHFLALYCRIDDKMDRLQAAKCSVIRKKIADLVISQRSLLKEVMGRTPILKATPFELKKKCGKLKCRCHDSEDYWHGPYVSISVSLKNGKQKRIVLNKNQKKWIILAQRFKKIKENFKLLKSINKEIEKQYKMMINERSLVFEDE